MLSGYVLIEAEPGKAEEINARLHDLRGVSQCHLVTWPFDVIAFVESGDLQTAGDLILHEIQRIPGVLKTVTCVVMGE